MRSMWIVPLAAMLAAALPSVGLAWLDPASPDVVQVLDAEDAQFSFYSDISQQTEWRRNWGGTSTGRLKGHQYYTALKFDLSAHRGRTVEQAELHLARANTDPLFAIVAATINADWHEGTGTGSTASVGQSCWRWRSMPANESSPPAGSEWTYPYSDFATATFGNYGSLVCYAYPVNGTMDTYSAAGFTWIRVQLDPDLVHALILDQYGLALTDPRGHPLPNAEIRTKEAGPLTQPRLYIRFKTEQDTTAPQPVADLRAEPGPENGTVVLHFAAAADPQAARAFGYDVHYDADAPATTPVERWRIPRPAAPGTAQKMLIEGLSPGMAYNFHVWAYDAAGNLSDVRSVRVSVPAARPNAAFAGAPFVSPNPAGRTVPTVPGVLRYWAVSELIKVNPVTGNRIEDGYTGTSAEDYKKANLVWDAGTNTISLTGSRNEMVGAQLIVEALAPPLTNVRIRVSDLVGPGLETIPSATHVELFQLHYVRSSTRYYADPAVPLSPPFPTTFAIPDPARNPQGNNQAVWIDVYVPKDVQPGTYRGTVTIEADQLAAPVTTNLTLDVSPAMLPDYPTFLIDLNGYGNKWDYGSDWRLNTIRWFQVAHKHRMVPNCLPYGWAADISGNRAPVLAGAGPTLHVADWSAFDEQYGGLFDGTAFSPDTPGSPYYGPGMHTPIANLYTTFFESWPIHVLDPVYGFDAPSLAGLPGTYGFGGQYWEDLIDGSAAQQAAFWRDAPDVWRAFPSGFWTGVQNIVKEWFEHAQQKGWHQTHFQVYLNHKYYYTEWADCAALWILEECVQADDFRAVNLFHNIYQAGAALADAPDVKWHWRIDISTRFGQNFGQLDNLLNLHCMSAASLQWYWPHIRYRQYSLTRPEQFWYYSTGPNASANGTAHAADILQQWARGADGGTPYWDNYANNWTSADQLSVYYSGQNIPGFGTYEGGIASVRMKMMRQAQQICEMLNLLAGQDGWDRQKATEALLGKYTNGNRDRAFGSLTETSIYRMRADLMAELEPLLRLTGDVDWDGEVSVIDVVKVVVAFGTRQSDPAFDPNLDLNGNGEVDVTDIVEVIGHFGQKR